jgi:hypothetical protein
MQNCLHLALDPNCLQGAYQVARHCHHTHYTLGLPVLTYKNHKKTPPSPRGEVVFMFNVHPRQAKMSTDKLADLLPYGYKPLGSSKKQIRLIRLGPRRDDGAIHCDLETHDSEDAPTYVALSYTWGPSSPVFNVHADDQSIVIRKNLHHFLEQYQKEDQQAR